MLQEIRLPEPCIHAGLMSLLLQNGYACRSGKCPLSELERTSFGTEPKSEMTRRGHGDNAKGNADLGAPDLTDRSWIYGGDAASVYDTVWGGRQGHMPSWDGRLSPLDRKILALYLFDLRRSER